MTEWRKRLSVLYVAYPLLAASDESAGGAEQMLVTLERAMVDIGHRTFVAASQGSSVSGELIDTGLSVRASDQYEAREAAHCAKVLAYLDEHGEHFDLIHDESGSFWRKAGKCSIPMLATLHLPRSFYREEGFANLPSNLFFNCVSESQARTFADWPNLLGAVQNGITLERFQFASTKQDYLLWLGRICEEKAPHLAIEAAKLANAPLVLAGKVYPFTYHQEYFERAIKPHLSDADGRVKFVDSPNLSYKVDLLRNARALLLTSTAEETSSLVAMEAMACGTPVVAFRRGAFPEIVADGVTGFVVETVEEMASALRQVHRLSSVDCRQRVAKQFSAARMAREYEGLYRQVLRESGASAVA